MRHFLILILFTGIFLSDASAQFRKWKRLDNQSWMLDSVAENGKMGIARTFKKSKDTATLQFLNGKYLYLNLDRKPVLTTYELIKGEHPYLLIKGGAPVYAQIESYSSDHLHLAVHFGDFPDQKADLFFKPMLAKPIDAKQLFIGQFREARDSRKRYSKNRGSSQTEIQLLENQDFIIKTSNRTDTGTWTFDDKKFAVTVLLKDGKHTLTMPFSTRRYVTLESDLFEDGYINLKQDSYYFERKKREALRKLRESTREEKREKPVRPADTPDRVEEMEIVEDEFEIEAPVAKPEIPRHHFLDFKTKWVSSQNTKGKSLGTTWTIKMNMNNTFTLHNTIAKKTYNGTWNHSEWRDELIFTIDGKEQSIHFKDYGKSYRDKNKVTLYILLPGTNKIRKILFSPKPEK